MKGAFRHLTSTEYQQLKEAIPLITILIAGADGNIDAQEKAWAEKITNIRTYSVKEDFQEYYEEVGEDFQSRLDALIEELPKDSDQRNDFISQQLSLLNPVLQKLEAKDGHQLYVELVAFAEHVAKASGGFLKFWSVSAEEKKWIGLPMIDPIDWEEEEA